MGATWRAIDKYHLELQSMVCDTRIGNGTKLLTDDYGDIRGTMSRVSGTRKTDEAVFSTYRLKNNFPNLPCCVFGGKQCLSREPVMRHIECGKLCAN